MFNVNFYTFNKKDNSTKRPSGTGTTYECILKEPSGIINPTIALNIGLLNNPSALNYCYIQAFNRYYYISEWNFDNGLWYASLSVDSLATAKDYIGDKDFYILRASAESDGHILDTKYCSTLTVTNQVIDIGDVLVTTDSTGQTLTYSDYFSKANVDSGVFYVGVLGDNSNGVTWISMLSATFKDFIKTMYTIEPDDMEDLSTGLAKKIANPIEYIVSAYWLPYGIPGMAYGSGTVKVGYYTYHWDAGASFIDPVRHVATSSATFTLPKHPKASARGAYLNSAPYTNYQLRLEPFGTFTLDSSVLVDKTSITCSWTTDINTGISDLRVFSGNELLISTTAQLAVPIQLNQVDINLIGAVGNKVGEALGASNAITTIVTDLASKVVGGFLGGEVSSTPKVQSKGNSGNFSPFTSRVPALYADFRDIVDEFNAEIGRPLCKVRKPRNIGGYIMVLDGSIEAPLTRNELQEINNYLTGGFFYE